MLSSLASALRSLFAQRVKRTAKRHSNLEKTANILSASTLPCTDHPKCETLNLCCNFSLPDDNETQSIHDPPPSYSPSKEPDNSDGFTRTIREVLTTIDPQLRGISLKLHAHPELQFEEVFAHDTLCFFMESHGFKVTRHYLGLRTAWRAEYSHGQEGRVIGVNSEMDALKGLGHACGHNLIAISGCGVAIALKTVLQKHNLSGTVVLLGTPAEESGGGKIILLERGAYDGMDICLMSHPTAGPIHSAGVGPSISMQSVEVEFFGHTAHAGAAPWEGTNALDAAFLAYANISVLRQQIKPDHRVHGIVEGKNWSPNVIPDYAKMRWYIRAPTAGELVILSDRIRKCFEAAGTATGCKTVISTGAMYFELRQNSVLADQFSDICSGKLGMTISKSTIAASTDFGNVSHVLPSLHPAYAIPTEQNGGNHTIAFARAASTREAHAATMMVSQGLAVTAAMVLYDDELFERIKTAFKRPIPP